jgi:hypothetical protein
MTTARSENSQATRNRVALHRDGSAAGYVCNWCDKKVRTYVPKGGDGSAKIVMSHKNKRGELCNGSWKLLPWA